jgi:L-ascorbate metabolism protein UlaG (beta-lactamase superfamily)
MHIQLIRSATLKVKMSNKIFLFDPWLARKGEGRSYAGHIRSPLVELPITCEEILSDIDAVIVSHLHSDHFDEKAQELLNPTIPIICHSRDVNALKSLGFSDVRGTSSRLLFGTITIKVTSGQHGPPEVLKDMGDVSGFVLTSTDEPRLYWVGDSIFCDAVRSVVAEDMPDVIVVHACAATWNGFGPLIMDAQMVLDLIKASKSAIVIATHLDCVDSATISREDLRSFAAAAPYVGNRLIIPNDGDTMIYEAMHQRS